jgi:hypothetical protein
MRKLLFLFLPLLLAIPTRATWNATTQFKSNTACSGGSCAVTVTSTGAGHIIVVGTMTTNNVTISSISGGGTYTHCSNCATGDATSGWVDMSYTASSTSGATTITANMSANGGSTWVAVVWEESSTLAFSFDASNNHDDTANCTSCTGTSLTLTGSNDAIFTIASCGGTCSAITTYTSDGSFPGGDGSAHLYNTNSGTAPTWTQSPTSHLATCAVSFKEASASAPTMPAAIY